MFDMLREMLFCTITDDRIDDSTPILVIDDVRGGRVLWCRKGNI
jgi:hypothetical protein